MSNVSKTEACQFVFEDYPDVVSVDQMSKMLGISTKTAYKLLKENKIIHLRFGRKYAIPKLHILNFIEVIQYA